MSQRAAGMHARESHAPCCRSASVFVVCEHAHASAHSSVLSRLSLRFGSRDVCVSSVRASVHIHRTYVRALMCVGFPIVVHVCLLGCFVCIPNCVSVCLQFCVPHPSVHPCTFIARACARSCVSVSPLMCMCAC